MKAQRLSLREQNNFSNVCLKVLIPEFTLAERTWHSKQSDNCFPDFWQFSCNRSLPNRRHRSFCNNPLLSFCVFSKAFVLTGGSRSLCQFRCQFRNLSSKNQVSVIKIRWVNDSAYQWQARRELFFHSSSRNQGPRKFRFCNREIFRKRAQRPPQDLSGREHKNLTSHSYTAANLQSPQCTSIKFRSLSNWTEQHFPTLESDRACAFSRKCQSFRHKDKFGS